MGGEIEVSVGASTVERTWPRTPETIKEVCVAVCGEVDDIGEKVYLSIPLKCTLTTSFLQGYLELFGSVFLIRCSNLRRRDSIHKRGSSTRCRNGDITCLRR